MQARSVRRLDEDLPRRRKSGGDLGAACVADRLRMEDQAVLQEEQGQRQRDGGRDQDLDERGDQPFWYSSPPFATNSTDFCSMPFST